MQLGMIGLGRMGANLVRRLMKAGHECVVYDVSADAVKALEGEGATGATTLEEFTAKLTAPRAAWIMVPAAVVESTLEKLVPLLSKDDIVIDGGNSYYHDDIRRAKELAKSDIHYVDVGTSGGVFGLERGFCLMIGGEDEVVKHLDPIFATIAPGVDARAAHAGEDREGEPRGERVSPLRPERRRSLREDGAQRDRVRDSWRRTPRVSTSSSTRTRGSRQRDVDAETTPLRNPELYQYDIDIPDVAEVWRRGSVVASWLLDLAAHALQRVAAARRLRGPRVRLR